MKNTIKYAFIGMLAAFALSQTAYARRPEVTHEDVVVAKGQTMNGDVATDRSITVDGKLDGNATAVGGASVTVNGELTGDLVSLGGPVAIPGLVDGDVSSIGGPVDISGKVSGNVSAVGGKITLSGSGQVDGDISVLGGGVVKGANAKHKGSVNSFSGDALKRKLTQELRTVRYTGNYSWRSGNVSEEGGQNPWLLGGLVGIGLLILFSMLLTGIVLLLLPAIFFPKNVENLAAAISGDMWRACGIGVIALVGFFPGLLMMLVSILGIPLTPFYLMLFAAAGVLGLSSFSAVLQGRFFEGIKKPGPAGLPGKVAAGYAIMAGLLFFGKLIPFIGGLLSLIGFMLLAFGIATGLGAAWMTRMGTRSFSPAAVLPAAAGQIPPAPVQ